MLDIAREDLELVFEIMDPDLSTLRRPLNIGGVGRGTVSKGGWDGLRTKHFQAPRSPP